MSAETPKVIVFAVNLNLCLPFVAITAYTKDACLIVRLSASPILSIDQMAHHAQVVDSVICLDAIAVVYFIIRPCSIHIQPCQPMRFVLLAI